MERTQLLECSISEGEKVAENLEAMILFLRNQQKLLSANLQSRRCLLAPIQKLPNELLEVIFENCCTPYSFDLLKSGWEICPALRLMHVSQHWCQVINETDQCWNKLRIVLQAATRKWNGFVESAFEQCWERSSSDGSSHIVIMDTGDSAILSLDEMPAESLSHLHWLIGQIMDLTQYGFGRMKLVIGPELVPRILATSYPNHPETRLVDLSLTKHLDLHLLHNRSESEWEIDILSFLEVTDPPSILRSLSISPLHSFHFTKVLPLFQQLTHLSLTMTVPDFLSHWPATSRFESLILRFYERLTAWNSLHITAAVERNITIDVKKFRLGYDTSVAGKLPSTLSPILQCIRLCGTEDVHIEVPTSLNVDAFYKVTLEKCLPVLKSIEINPCYYELDKSIIQSSTPLLHTLVLSEPISKIPNQGWLGNTRPRQALFRALNFDYTEAGIPGNPTPSLQTIHLSINEWWTSEDFEVLLSMLQSRWSPLRSLDMAKALTGREMLRSFEIKCISPAATVPEVFLNALLGLKRPWLKVLVENSSGGVLLEY
jgi:hypothetical protein